MGTFSALSVAIFLKEKVDGVVVTSSVTRSAKNWDIYRSHPLGVLSMELEEIKVPTLVVSHRDDQCRLTPASDSPKLVKRLSNARKAEVIYFEGGDPPRSGPCEALSAHGFLGIENKVVEAIADFIKGASK